MQLFITEKPKTARQLSAALGESRHIPSSNSTKFGGHKHGQGWAVAWLSGHFYRLYEPHDYDASLKRWSKASLPITHTEPNWKVDDSPTFPPQHEIEEQIAHIQSLYPKVTELVLATDADQEGQVLGQVFLEQSGWTGPVKRFWTDLWEEEGVRRALGNLRDNREFQGVFEAGLSRIISDQMVGINFTRLLTLKASNAGYTFTANAGRVRSSCLMFVVDHDRRVKEHTARPYYSLRANLQHLGAPFSAKLVIPPSLLEDDEHCFDPEPIRQIQAALGAERQALVKSIKRSQNEQRPPEPFSQNTLSQYCAKYHSMMPDETEAAAQSLYEDGLMSYPRVDSTAYEASVLNQVPGTFAMLAGVNDDFAAAVAGANLEQPQPVFVDAGVDGHSAIYVSSQKPNLARRTPQEVAVYTAVALRMIAQFYGSHVTSSDKVTLGIADYTFVAESSAVVRAGWTALIPAEEKESPELPALNEGDQCDVDKIELRERKTKSPPRLTVEAFQETLRDCTHLLSDSVRNRMGKARGQLGTGATQKGYLKELVGQGVVAVEEKKFVLPTRRGIELARLLPRTLATADMTSLWELHFRAIRSGQRTRSEFVASVTGWLEKEIQQLKDVEFPPSPTINACPRCACALIRRPQRSKKNSHYWQCSNEDCRTSTPDKGGKPMELHPKDGTPCPKCKSPLRTLMRKKDRARILGCSNRECKHFED